jgi:hypothetical protein
MRVAVLQFVLSWFLFLASPSLSGRGISLRHLLYLNKLRTKSDRVRIHYVARLAFFFRLLTSLIALLRR